MLTARTLSLLLIGILALAACDRKPTVKAAPAEPWVSQAHAKWPQILLTNDGQFRGHTPMEGASSFLVKAEDGRTFAVTAKHLLGDDGGVSPGLDPTRFNEVLTSWRMHPRTVEDLSVEVDKLVAHGKGDEDWILFSLKKKANLPSRPLRVRGNRVEVGETVYMIGCPYEEEDCKQNVYLGKVASRYYAQFTFTFAPPVDLSGFSGAPIVDANGHLVGIATGWANARDAQRGSGGAASAQGVEAICQWLESGK